MIAVDGEPTGGDPTFNLMVTPPTGSAQFGCNRGGGPLSVGNGWLVPGDPWIVTLAGCMPKEKMRFEHKGFRILGAPLAIEARPGGAVRLQNGRGSIDISRTPPLTVADIAGTWNVVSINGVGTPGGTRFRATFAPREFTARFGCNEFRGVYATEGDRLGLTLAGNTEMLCEPADPNAFDVAPMQFEQWAEAILRSGPEVVLKSEYGMEIVGQKGTINLVRVR